MYPVNNFIHLIFSIMTCSTENHVVRWSHGNKEAANRTTTCVILDNKGQQLQRGIARVGSGDQFNKSTGRFISFKRAIEDSGQNLTKAERRSLWEAYKSNVKFPSHTPKV